MEEILQRIKDEKYRFHPGSEKGSHITKLIATMVPLIISNITWILGNGKKN